MSDGLQKDLGESRPAIVDIQEYSEKQLSHSAVIREFLIDHLRLVVVIATFTGLVIVTHGLHWAVDFAKDSCLTETCNLERGLIGFASLIVLVCGVVGLCAIALSMTGIAVVKSWRVLVRVWKEEKKSNSGSSWDDA